MQDRSIVNPGTSPAKAPSRRWLRRLAILAVLAVCAAIAAVMLARAKAGVPGWTDQVAPIEPKGITGQALLAELSQPGPAVTANGYQDLFKYLLEGFVGYRSPQGARAFYPGAHGDKGSASDGLEAFARFFPLAAAWLVSGQPDELQLGDHTVLVSQLFTQGLLAGTDPTSPEYWGKYGDYAQAGYESGDIAVALWISREQIWSRLAPAQRKQVADWLAQVLDIKMYPGNWSLVPLVVHRSLKTLGVDVARYDERAETMFERYQSLSRGGGWFDDPPNGFDYYNSWAIHYHLFWLSQMDPTFHADSIRAAQSAFGESFKYLFGPNGLPMYGRSVCYRLGAATGLLTSAANRQPQTVPVGQAMRALDTSLRYYGSHGALAAGGVTQGFCGTNLAVVDAYTGPASCLQGLRALTVAFYLEPSLHVFEAAREPLPVEAGDFTHQDTVTGWTITGTRQSGNIDLTIDRLPPDARVPFAPYTWRNRLVEWLVHGPHRPNNHRALYDSRSYSTAQPGVSCQPSAGGQ